MGWSLTYCRCSGRALWKGCFLLNNEMVLAVGDLEEEQYEQRKRVKARRQAPRPRRLGALGEI